MSLARTRVISRDVLELPRMLPRKCLAFPRGDPEICDLIDNVNCHFSGSHVAPHALLDQVAGGRRSMLTFVSCRACLSSFFPFSPFRVPRFWLAGGPFTSSLVLRFQFSPAVY